MKTYTEVHIDAYELEQEVREKGIIAEKEGISFPLFYEFYFQTGVSYCLQLEGDYTPKGSYYDKVRYDIIEYIKTQVDRPVVFIDVTE